MNKLLQFKDHLINTQSIHTLYTLTIDFWLKLTLRKKFKVDFIGDGALSHGLNHGPLITNREFKFKKINTINVNWKLFQICTHYRHSDKVSLWNLEIN